ncbi:hypothetical protein LEL_02481 [Akanthomyces lecanii RCEF 1005]|uniref:Pheromone-regulated membrane protein n=1 Tax=Akanthomyces lecanii RCEF 1005 TaxID=1081108 RepID=A0A162IW79_CORDF|nr:hypothetical protein LEL_02481 [Akanthomyces lecanii RCEF 1005]
MGCCGNRKKVTREFAQQKWDYINLQDFKASGCGTPFAYGYLYFSLIISIAVYSIDSFTAVQLIAFNRWSSAIKPTISFDVSKWIFSICIILSFINLGYEAIRATRVIKRNNIAESYMDPLAVRWESVRFGKAQGWRRFLVFASLTKSKKGAHYIALFTYFSFKSWIRVLVCSGPRQVINAFTLKSVYEAKLATQAKSVDGAFLGFFDKVKILAQEDYRQAAILSGMAFTFVVWAFALIFLLVAVIFYVTFLFYWIPKADGGLTGYCERKVNKALLSIVNKKINKAFAKNEAKKMKAEAKYYKVTGEKLQPERAATLPDIALADDKLPGMPMLNRADTGSTLPGYQTRPSTPGGIELSSMNRAALARSETNGSDSSYSPNVPLMSAAADMGYGPAPIQPPMIPPQRPGTAMSQRSQASGVMPLQRPGTAMSQRGPAPGMLPQRPGTANSQHSQASRAGTGTQYPYGNAPTPRPGMQRPTGPGGGPSIPGAALGSMPVLGEESSRFGLGPSNSQRSVGSHSVSSMGESVDGSEHAFRQGAANAAPQRGMQAPSQKQFRPYNPNVRPQSPAAGNPYSAEQYGNPMLPPVRSATMGSALPSGPLYPAQRSVTGPVPVRAATTDPYFQRGPPAQNAPFAPIQRSNTGEEFANGRWVPPSQRNNPQAYDLEAQFNNGQRYQY